MMEQPCVNGKQKREHQQNQLYRDVRNYVRNAQRLYEVEFSGSMRLLLTTFLTTSLSLLLAQVPQAIKYQAVVRDSTGSILADANVTLRVSIIDPE